MSDIIKLNKKKKSKKLEIMSIYSNDYLYKDVNNSD